MGQVRTHVFNLFVLPEPRVLGTSTLNAFVISLNGAWYKKRKRTESRKESFVKLNSIRDGPEKGSFFANVG